MSSRPVSGQFGEGYCGPVGGGTPLARIFWGIWQCFPCKLLDNLAKRTGILNYGLNSPGCQSKGGEGGCQTNARI